MSDLFENISDESVHIARSAFAGCQELLAGRISLLAGRDRLWMRMYVNKGLSFNQIALLAQVSPGTVARVINRSARALLTGDYIRCLRNRRLFTTRQLRIARDRFLRRLSVPRLAARYATSSYAIRKQLRQIRCALDTPTPAEAACR